MTEQDGWTRKNPLSATRFDPTRDKERTITDSVSSKFVPMKQYPIVMHQTLYLRVPLQDDKPWTNSGRRIVCKINSGVEVEKGVDVLAYAMQMQSNMVKEWTAGITNMGLRNNLNPTEEKRAYKIDFEVGRRAPEERVEVAYNVELPFDDVLTKSNKRKRY